MDKAYDTLAFPRNYAVVARMDPSSEVATDYLVVPKAAIKRDRTYFGDHNLNQLAR